MRAEQVEDRLRAHLVAELLKRHQVPAAYVVKTAPLFTGRPDELEIGVGALDVLVRHPEELQRLESEILDAAAYLCALPIDAAVEWVPARARIAAVLQGTQGWERVDVKVPADFPITNHGWIRPEFRAEIIHDGVRHRSHTETWITTALTEAGLSFLPLPLLLVSEGRKRFEPDFIVLHPQRVFVIEVDGPHHRDIVEKDAERDRWLEQAGLEVHRIPVARLQGPEDAVREVRAIVDHVEGRVVSVAAGGPG